MVPVIINGIADLVEILVIETAAKTPMQNSAFIGKVIRFNQLLPDSKLYPPKDNKIITSE